jgi:hypothetical protein
MADGHTVPTELHDHAARFADNLTERIQRILPTDVRFTALTMAGGDGVVGVGYIVQDRFLPLPLLIGGVHRLDLLVKLHCAWDRTRDFLAVEESWVHATAAGRDTTPLFRYEYLRNATRDVPCAHLQIHAHRDEVTYLMLKSEQHRPADRRRADKVPRFAEFHFPLGGHRFRPCLEDILHAVVAEFGVDRKGDWRTAVQEGREEWRRMQLRAAVRDAPEDARQALEGMGYLVTPPQQGLPGDQSKRLRAF